MMLPITRSSVRAALKWRPSQVPAPLVPAIALVEDAAFIEPIADFFGAAPTERQIEDLLHDRRSVRVDFERRTLLGAILDLDALVAVRGLRCEKEATRGRLSHPARDLLRQDSRNRTRPRSR